MSSPSVKSTIPSAFILGTIGWLGLIYLFKSTLPTLGPRWLFFFFGVLAVTGVFLPVSAFLNIRFPSKPKAERKVVVREASLMGVFIASLAWLQLGRVLSPGLGFLIAGCLILVELLLRLRERSRWEP